MRLDDLESVLVQVLEGLAYARTSGERCTALEIAEELPTMRAYLADNATEEDE